MNNVVREQALQQWAGQQCTATLTHWRMISGDASFRRYFRFHHNEQSIIAVDAPPERENVRGFLFLADYLARHGMRVPSVLAQDPDHGFWLLDDFGDTLLLSVLNEKTVHRYYTAAIDELVQFQRIAQPVDFVLPKYDRERFTTEVNLMPTWLLSAHLDVTVDDALQHELSRTFDYLIEQALAQPRVLTHRDFHARNLMVLESTTRLGLIDFQDTVLGPLSYDLVSLLKDCYIAWPRATVLAMVEYYFRQAQSLPAMNNVSREQFIQAFDLMGLQRHIKVLGIFCRLYYRDGKSHYLADLPRVLNYTIDTAERYPATRSLGGWLRDVIAPRLTQKNATVLSALREIN